MKINLDSTKRINEKDLPSTAIIQLFKIVELLPLNDVSEKSLFQLPNELYYHKTILSVLTFFDETIEVLITC